MMNHWLVSNKHRSRKGEADITRLRYHRRGAAAVVQVVANAATIIGWLITGNIET